MRKIATFLAAVLLVTFAGCGGPAKKEETFYNGYLGLTAVIPSGWYVDIRNEINLTKTPEESADFTQLDLYDYTDGGYELELMTLQNRQDSTDDNHAEFSISAEYYPDFSAEEYLDMFTEFTLGMSDDTYTYTLMERGVEQINGQDFTRFVFEVAFSDDTVPYYEEYYIAPVKDVFFIAYMNYWSDSNVSKGEAQNALETCFKLEKVGAAPSATVPGDGVQAV